MSLEESLELLEFKSLEEVTIDSLRQSFRRLSLQSHPDKGGSSEQFDSILSAYIYLSRAVRRHLGGRDKQVVLDVKAVQEARDKQFTLELNNMVNEVFDQLEHDKLERDQPKDFFHIMDKIHTDISNHTTWLKSSEDRGYKEWLSSTEFLLSTVSFVEDGVGTYGNLTMKAPIIQEADLNKMFEYQVTCGKACPTTLSLHPNEMACPIASGGSLLLPGKSDFTSDMLESPEFCDVRAAFTVENTQWDKIPRHFQERSYETLLQEREIVYTADIDRDLEALSAYETRKQQEEIEHKKNIQAYFQNTYSSHWALSEGK